VTLVESSVPDSESSVGRPTPARRPVIALLAANAISLVGNSLAALAIPWFVLITTGSAGKTGLVAFAQMLPTVLAAFFGGALVDRMGAKRVSIIADIASSVAVALIPLLHHTVGLSFTLLVILVFLGAVLDTPGGTARETLLPELVERAGMVLERANAASQTIQSLANLIGPALAGVLIAWLGARNVLWVDAATFVVSSILVATAVPSVSRRVKTSGRYFDELMDGLRFLGRHQLLRTILIMAAILNFLMPALFSVIMPVFAKEIFGRPESLGGILAGFGAGSLLGALAFGAMGPRLPRRTTLIGLLAVACISPAGLIALPPLLVVILLMGLLGFCAGAVNPLVFTVLQERAPAELRGRVFGAVLAFVLIAAPAGTLIAGLSLEVLSLRSVFIAITAIQALVVVGLLFQPVLREMDQRPGTGGQLA